MMEAIVLRELILEFVEQTAAILNVDTGTSEGVLTAQETLTLWMQLPDCAYSAMFLGWLLAKGHDINSFSPTLLAQAIQSAAVGDNKNVMFDWYGDDDASNKPH